MSTLISFDYAIKYLLKDKGNYDIVEGFISAIIGSAGYGAIKIKALLDTESNKESTLLKRSIADLVVEDESGNYYIVEIDKAYTDLFLHKACFNSSRLIVDNLGTDQNYLEIKKVFHINLLYFPFKNTKAPVHHGKVMFHEVDHDNPVDMNKDVHIFDSFNIFPEYFLISIPLFDDVIMQELDEWLYVMKNSDVKSDFKSPYMKKVAKRLNFLKMSAEERARYSGYMMESYKDRDYMVSAKAEGEAIGEARGIEKGRAEGLVEGMEQAAINMLKQKSDDAFIMSITGLSLDQLNDLKKKL